MFETSGGKIGKESVSTPRRFATNILWNIADGEIYGVHSFIAEQSHLSFVSRDDNRYNGCAWLLLVELFLFISGLVDKQVIRHKILT
jgi:hypothetical protein